MVESYWWTGSSAIVFGSSGWTDPLAEMTRARGSGALLVPGLVLVFEAGPVIDSGLLVHAEDLAIDSVGRAACVDLPPLSGEKDDGSPLGGRDLSCGIEDGAGIGGEWLVPGLGGGCGEGGQRRARSVRSLIIWRLVTSG